jgi:hypothetical protein
VQLVIFLHHATNGSAADLLNYADPVIGINDFVTDVEIMIHEAPWRGVRAQI